MNLGDDNLSLLSIFLNLHILNKAKILYSEWPKYPKYSLNDNKTTNLLHFVLLHNYEFNLSLISVFQNFKDQLVYVLILFPFYNEIICIIRYKKLSQSYNLIFIV